MVGSNQPHGSHVHHNYIVVTTRIDDEYGPSGDEIQAVQLIRSYHCSLHTSLDFHVASDVLVRGEPDPGTGAYVLDQLLQDAQARAMADDMGVHGEQK